MCSSEHSIIICANKTTNNGYAEKDCNYYRAASEVWILRIRKLKLEDAGDYECQLSGDPPTTQTITLVVHGKREEEAVEETILQKVMVVEEEEEVVAKVAKVVQRTRSSNVDKVKQENSEEATLGGSSIVMAGGCLVVVVVCLLSLGAVRQCLGAEARAGERPMPCAKSTQVRGSIQIAEILRLGELLLTNSGEEAEKHE